MTTASPGRGNTAAGGADLTRLWIGILGPPSIWAVRIAASYILVPYACWWGWIPALHLATGIALLATAAVGVMAWRAWRAVGGGAEVELGDHAARTRFMAIVGMSSSALFFVVIVAEGLANVFIDPCQTAGAPLA